MPIIIECDAPRAPMKPSTPWDKLSLILHGDFASFYDRQLRLSNIDDEETHRHDLLFIASRDRDDKSGLKGWSLEVVSSRVPNQGTR